MHLRISTNQLVHRILHVVTLHAVGVQGTAACVGILGERRPGITLRDRRDPAARSGRPHAGMRHRDSPAIRADSKEGCVRAPLTACDRDLNDHGHVIDLESHLDHKYAPRDSIAAYDDSQIGNWISQLTPTAALG